ncbi:MAG: trypsin-like peptidase domain-containing protein [Caldilineaceae bacterium]
MNDTMTSRRRELLLLVGMLMVIVSACGGGAERAENRDNGGNEVVTIASASNAPVQSQARLQQPQDDFPSQQLLGELYDQILPSVVDIEVTAATSQADTDALPFPFGQQPGPLRGEGSGWVYDDQGHIVTNNHVVEDADEIIINFANGAWATGEVVATDPQADLAVVQVTPPDGMELNPLPLAAVDTIDVGNWVLAFGTPFGLDKTMTLGIISALGRGFPVGEAAGGATYTLPDVIQTDAAINPGNSGGPLVNLNGEVIGVNFAINSASGSNSGVGFAIPISVVQQVVPALIQEGSYAYPYLGISGGSVTPQLAEEQGVPENLFGVWVSSVVEGGPAAEAGLQQGDIITAIDGQTVRSFDALVSYLFNSTTPGQEVTITYVRNGAEQTATLTVQERPAAQEMASDQQSEATISIGQAIEIARQTVLNAGLMDSVDSTSANLQSGDGHPIWIVTLTSGDQTATVSVDAITGNVIGMNIE